MNDEPKNLEEMMARFGRAVIVVDDESDGIKVMGMGGAHSVDFDGKPKPGVKRPKNDGFDPDEDETVEAKGDGFMCKAQNEIVGTACPECKGGCEMMGYKQANNINAHNEDEEEMYVNWKQNQNEQELKMIDYLESLDDGQFDEFFPLGKDDDSSLETKVIFDVATAFARRALTNRRRRKRKLFKDVSDDTEIKGAGPCWPGYKQVGMKRGKGGKMVPNCVPVDGKSEEQECCPEDTEIETKAAKKKLRDPKGGLTAAGRAHFKRTEGANLKPGVKGAADTPDKMRRKGSFLTRFFTNPSGPMKDEKGRPTRLALSAAAWGEPVPQNAEDAAALAAKGRRMLERYENAKKKKKK